MFNTVETQNFLFLLCGKLWKCKLSAGYVYHQLVSVANKLSLYAN